MTRINFLADEYAIYSWPSTSTPNSTSTPRPTSTPNSTQGMKKKIVWNQIRIEYSWSYADWKEYRPIWNYKWCPDRPFIDTRLGKMRKGRSKLAVRIGGKIINPAQLGFPKVAYGRLTLTDLDRPTDWPEKLPSWSLSWSQRKYRRNWILVFFRFFIFDLLFSQSVWYPPSRQLVAMSRFFPCWHCCLFLYENCWSLLCQKTKTLW